MIANNVVNESGSRILTRRNLIEGLLFIPKHCKVYRIHLQEHIFYVYINDCVPKT